MFIEPERINPLRFLGVVERIILKLTVRCEDMGRCQPFHKNASQPVFNWRISYKLGSILDSGGTSYCLTVTFRIHLLT
jgi:hypothetical protein